MKYFTYTLKYFNFVQGEKRSTFDTYIRILKNSFFS